ncbi:MAG TPA: ABC transporter substrate-binding protein, partial [Phototrophicaceae bacterium]|nr:ABC transporter substrate-binding protein [Phototrophicaceae bacterium]
MSIKYRFPVSAILTVLILAAVVGLTSAQTATETLTIGFIGSSSETSLDRQLYQAAELAASDLNADSEALIGPDDTRYALQINYYEADTVEEATDALQDAVDDRVIAVLGPQDTELSQAIIDQGTPAVPVILGAPDAGSGTDIFKATASYDTRAKAAADYLANERHFDKIALEAVNTDVAQSAADAFRAALDSDLIVADLTHAADKTSFASDARTIRDSRADALFAFTLDAQMLNLLKALKEVGWNGTIIYSGLDADFVTLAGGTLAGADLTQNL